MLQDINPEEDLYDYRRNLKKRSHLIQDQTFPSPVGGNNAATQQNNNPLYGSAPAPQAANPASSGEANENAPLYADNTEMKKVFSGAFGNNNNIG